MFTILEILGLAEKLEMNAEQFYRESTRMFSDPSLILLLEWLADAERQHFEWFSKKKSALGARDEKRELIEAGALKEILGDQTFSLKEVDLSKIKDTASLVEHALEFERDTILFYEMIRSFLEDPQSVEKLDEIIAEEHSHIQKLQSYRVNIPSSERLS